MLGIQVLDHIVVGMNREVSFREEEMMLGGFDTVELHRRRILVKICRHFSCLAILPSRCFVPLQPARV